MTSIVVSVIAALATLAIVLLALRLPRVTGEGTDERIAAVTIDMNRRMEALRHELGDALERAQEEAGRQRVLGDLAGATGLEGVLRRTLEAAAEITGAEAALVQTSAREERRVVANLGLAPDEARALTIAGSPERVQPSSIRLSYRYDPLDVPGEHDPIRAGLAVALPGEAGPIGYLCVFTRSAARTFDDRNARALEELATRAGPAIHNARLIHEARALVDVDALTGLANRRRFGELLEREASDVGSRYRPLSVILFDLDDFRAVNRRLGPEVGDTALRETAARGKETLGRGTTFARIGGDEFGVILPDAALGEADQVCRRLRGALAAPPTGQAGILSFSAGIGQLGPDEDVAALLRRVDAALHRAQRGGSDIVVSERV